ncbi:AAA family ATPase [Chimaeribacter arupi]|uniref:AAA family ATPase n=1 Tax=Chimaeribacter arupi TaxID=2060066 RepID=UPI00294550E0|nr:AAA family ATPase [Chimaeribacter arupi]MDV5141470.1 AAA family ATPase [Chimaeribacter arupi]
MKLSKIEIHNFRCFSSLTLCLHPQLTVLVAQNGAGKTTLLDAVRIAVWPYVKAFDLGSQAGKSVPIEIDDVRRIKMPEGNMESVPPACVKAEGCWGDEKLSWTQTREKITPRSNTLSDTGVKHVMNIGTRLQKTIRERTGEEVLPVIVYLGSGRLWSQGRLTEKSRLKDNDDMYSRFWAYRDCLTAVSSYKQFEQWYTWVCESELEQLVKPELSGNSNPRFSDARQAVANAVNQLITEQTQWRDITYSVQHQRKIVLTHPDHGTLPLELLSDGLRNAIVMVADIAFRCVRLNPQLGSAAPLKTPGIVMIDEVDMFLHPAWQQTIVQSLQQAFPAIQFILTTHSPQVISTVASDSIRILDNGQIYDGPQGTQGAESRRILERVFQTPGRPPKEANTQMLARYLQLVDAEQGESEEARALRARLDAVFGNEEPELTRADIQIDNLRWEQEVGDEDQDSEENH